MTTAKTVAEAVASAQQIPAHQLLNIAIFAANPETFKEGEIRLPIYTTNTGEIPDTYKDKPVKFWGNTDKDNFICTLVGGDDNAAQFINYEAFGFADCGEYPRVVIIYLA